MPISKSGTRLRLGYVAQALVLVRVLNHSIYPTTHLRNALHYNHIYIAREEALRVSFIESADMTCPASCSTFESSFGPDISSGSID